MTKTTLARLRLTQRLLIAAGDSDPGLHTDEAWQRSLCNVTQLCERALSGAEGRRLERELKAIEI